MKKCFSIVLSVALALSSALIVSASDYEDIEIVPDDENEVTESIGDELGGILDGLPDLSEAFTPEEVYNQEEDKAEGEEAPEREPAPAADNGISPIDSTFCGAWSGAILDYFSGVMRSHPFKDYVCYRRDQYTYLLYFGTDIDVDGSNFSGSGLNCITYTTNNGYNNEYIQVSEGVSFSYHADGIFYTNCSELGANLEGVKQIEWLIVACVLLGLLIGISLLRGLFK